MAERWQEFMLVGDLAPAPTNPKRHDLEALRASLGRFGLIEPVTIDERTGRLVGGHGRTQVYAEAEAAGLEPPEGVSLDEEGRWLVPVSRGWRSADDMEASAAGIALNRTGELGGWDAGELSASLAEQAAGPGLEGVGYSAADLEELLEQLHAGEPSSNGSQALAGYAERFSEPLLIEMAAQHYEAAGFPYPSTPLHEKLWAVERLARCSFEELAGTQLAHGVADEYHPHRYAVVVTGAPWSVLQAFGDPKCLRKALQLALEQNGSLTRSSLVAKLALVNRCQAAANFRPGFALRLLREFCPPDGTVLDSSAGFGGRLVGFAASHAGLYVGIDPSAETQAGNRRLAEDLQLGERVQLLELPAEDVEPASLPACDFAMTSPPYFAKERYSEEPTQSWVRYKTAEAWRAGFLGPMLRLQFAALRSGAVSAINVADVKIKGAVVPLVEWTAEEAEAAGFERLASTLAYGLARVPGDDRREDWQEPVLLFRKP